MASKDKPRKLIIDCETREQRWEELEGDELAAYLAHEGEKETPEPRPLEVLNEGIQGAANMADVKRVFAEFAERYGDRL